MAQVLEFRRLSPEDGLDGFSCGDPSTDRYLRYFAARAQALRGLASTWVALDGDTVVGCLTASTATLDRARFPDAALRKRLPDYPLPVLRVSRLGVALGAQRRGLGTALLARAEALGRLLRAPGGAGLVGLVVDAPEAAAGFLEGRGFTRLGGRILEGALHGGASLFFRPLGA